MEKSVFTNITNDNSETDSSTSTPSEDFMSSFYPKPSSGLKKQLIQPILPKPYLDSNSGIEVDDCFELSLLRFIHLIFGSNGCINFTNFTKYIDLTKKECEELYDFFLDNPGIFDDAKFYYSEAGINLRKKWVEFLSLRNFEYKKSESIINPNIKNLIKFLENFFPKININNNLSNNFLLQEVYSQLNFNWESLELVYGEFQKIIGTSIHQSSVQNIVINKTPIFIWEMTRILEIIEETPVEIYSNSELRYS
jgi:hypothetical protein